MVATRVKMTESIKLSSKEQYCLDNKKYHEGLAKMKITGKSKKYFVGKYKMRGCPKGRSKCRLCSLQKPQIKYDMFIKYEMDEHSARS